jgi:1-pyrroline-5-carboxylate dehydrogenase
MSNSLPAFGMLENEPVLDYEPGSIQRKELKHRIAELKEQRIEIPLIIGGKEVRTDVLGKCIAPHEHRHVLAEYHKAGREEAGLAIRAALDARKMWSEFEWTDRIAIFKKAADMLSTNWRSTMNAATMLGQSKSVYQAEIDSACELADFLRFNSYFVKKVYEEQPLQVDGSWNEMEYRSLEGFVFAVTPFNFTAIGGNLPTAPAIMGNVVVWKPASTAVYSAYFFMKLLEEAGLPEGVINFIPGNSAEISDIVLSHRELAGVNFTGSTEVFQSIWETVGRNVKGYRSYPRLVGETGGKDFVVAHESADINVLATALVRGAFEYQGQKCSATSRAYIPDNMWPRVWEKMLEELKEIKVGSVEDFSNYMNAVIDKSSFDKIRAYIDLAGKSSDAEIIFGGDCDDSVGYFIEPTVILTRDPEFVTMREEIFGPVLTVYVYDAKDFENVLELCDRTSPYGLTGSIFARDRAAIALAKKALVNAAGNFYINDKTTGATVGQQPFGGSRASGTNDKTGSMMNLLRWVSARSIKENFIPPEDFRYPFMREP